METFLVRANNKQTAAFNKLYLVNVDAWANDIATFYIEVLYARMHNWQRL